MTLLEAVSCGKHLEHALICIYLLLFRLFRSVALHCVFFISVAVVLCVHLRCCRGREACRTRPAREFGGRKRVKEAALQLAPREKYNKPTTLRNNKKSRLLALQRQKYIRIRVP